MWWCSSPSRSASSLSSPSTLNTHHPISLLLPLPPSRLVNELEFLAITSSRAAPRSPSYSSRVAISLSIFSGTLSSRFFTFFYFFSNSEWIFCSLINVFFGGEMVWLLWKFGRMVTWRTSRSIFTRRQGSCSMS